MGRFKEMMAIEMMSARDRFSQSKWEEIEKLEKCHTYVKDLFTHSTKRLIRLLEKKAHAHLIESAQSHLDNCIILLKRAHDNLERAYDDYYDL